jgi:hypothetical protein
MFAGASTRICTQAGTDSSAMLYALSNLLNLSLNPATERRDLIAVVELDPSILLEFLSLKMPTQLSAWHESFEPIHFLVTAARLAMDQLREPPTLDQWQRNITIWRDALSQRCLVSFFAEAQQYPDAEQHSAALTGLLASTVDHSSPQLPAPARDAIRFQFAPADALKDTDSLIRIIATSTQLIQNRGMPVRQGYLNDWELPNIDLHEALENTREQILELNNDIERPGENPSERYRSDIEQLMLAMRRYQYKILVEPASLTQLLPWPRD